MKRYTIAIIVACSGALINGLALHNVPWPQYFVSLIGTVIWVVGSSLGVWHYVKETS